MSVTANITKHGYQIRTETADKRGEEEEGRALVIAIEGHDAGKHAYSMELCNLFNESGFKAKNLQGTYGSITANNPLGLATEMFFLAREITILKTEGNKYDIAVTELLPENLVATLGKYLHQNQSLYELFEKAVMPFRTAINPRLVVYLGARGDGAAIPAPDKAESCKYHGNPVQHGYNLESALLKHYSIVLFVEVHKPHDEVLGLIYDNALMLLRRH